MVWIVHFVRVLVFHWSIIFSFAFYASFPFLFLIRYLGFFVLSGEIRCTRGLSVLLSPRFRFFSFFFFVGSSLCERCFPARGVFCFFFTVPLMAGELLVFVFFFFGVRSTPGCSFLPRAALSCSHNFHRPAAPPSLPPSHRFPRRCPYFFDCPGPPMVRHLSVIQGFSPPPLRLAKPAPVLLPMFRFFLLLF